MFVTGTDLLGLNSGILYNERIQSAVTAELEQLSGTLLLTESEGGLEVRVTEPGIVSRLGIPRSAVLSLRFEMVRL